MHPQVRDLNWTPSNYRKIYYCNALGQDKLKTKQFHCLKLDIISRQQTAYFCIYEGCIEDEITSTHHLQLCRKSGLVQLENTAFQRVCYTRIRTMNPYKRSRCRNHLPFIIIIKTSKKLCILGVLVIQHNTKYCWYLLVSSRLHVI